MEQPQPLQNTDKGITKESEPVPESDEGCAHNIVYDHIDITPDRSENIWYCDKCWQTFNEGITNER